MEFRTALIIQLMCVACVVRTDIPYEQLDIEIVRNMRSTMAKMKETEDFLRAKTVEGVAPSVTPYVGLLRTTLPILRVDLIEGLVAIRIAEAFVDTRISAKDIRNIETTMLTIYRKIESLNDSSNVVRASAVQYIHDALDSIVNQFDNVNAIQRKHPLTAVRPLFSIASFVAIFHPIVDMIVPELAGRTRLPCKVTDILLDYRPLVVYARLKEIHLKVATDFVAGNSWTADISCEGHFGKGPVRNALLDVMRIPYDRRGYNESDLGVINCSSRTNPETIYDWFAVDNVNYKTYFAGRCDRDDREDCFRDYMRLVRHRTESAFEAPLRQMQGIPCVMRQTTGKGWIIMTIQRVRSNSGSCDFMGSCDPYVKIFIKGEQVYQTTKHKDTTDAIFDETFTSQKIDLVGDTIRIEVWDSDIFLNGSDDKMFVVEGNYEQLFGRVVNGSATISEFSGNDLHLHTNTVWKAEYR